MNNVVRIDLYIAVRDLRANWKLWDIVTRSEAVAGLRRSHVSVATLARIADCSEAWIRRLKVIDQLSPELKARIRAGEPSGKFVALASAQIAIAATAEVHPEWGGRDEKAPI